jgi:hypothetical protein
MLHLYFPKKDLHGEFITLATARDLRSRDSKESVTFIWKDGDVLRFDRPPRQGPGRSRQDPPGA